MILVTLTHVDATLSAKTKMVMQPVCVNQVTLDPLQTADLNVPLTLTAQATKLVSAKSVETLVLEFVAPMPSALSKVTMPSVNVWLVTLVIPSKNVGANQNRLGILVCPIHVAEMPLPDHLQTGVFVSAHPTSSETHSPLAKESVNTTEIVLLIWLVRTISASIHVKEASVE